MEMERDKDSVRARNDHRGGRKNSQNKSIRYTVGQPEPIIGITVIDQNQSAANIIGEKYR